MAATCVPLEAILQVTGAVTLMLAASTALAWFIFHMLRRGDHV